MKAPFFGIGILVLGLLPTSLATRAENVPSVPAAAAPVAIAVTYIANEGFLIEADGKSVLIDALFETGFGTFAEPTASLQEEMAAARDRFAGIDVVLITHRHRDHFSPKLVASYMRHNPRAELVAPPQVVEQLRTAEGLGDFANRIHAVMPAGDQAYRVTVNGVAIDVLSLTHSHDQNTNPDVENLGFVVDLGRTRFFHPGDALIEQNTARLNAYPFDRARVDVLFLLRTDLSAATRQLITQWIKPGHIVAMHVPPAGFLDHAKEIHAAYLGAILFEKEMERQVFTR